MKTTIGIHPDLPFPFSNAPEPEPKPAPVLAEALPLASERHEHGVAALAAMLNHWLGASGLSHDQMVSISAWGLGERGMLDPAVISRIRNGKQARGAGLRHLDALAAANHAIWLWQQQGEQGAWAKLGPHSGWGVRSEWLEDAIWLPHPDHLSEPLCFADLAEVVAGYLDLPYLTTQDLSPAAQRRMSEALVALLERTAAGRGWGPREARHQLLEAYPVSDQSRRRRLRDVIVGDHSLRPEELELEMHALAEMLRAVRGIKPGGFAPEDLRRELLSGLPPDHG